MKSILTLLSLLLFILNTTSAEAGPVPTFVKVEEVTKTDQQPAQYFATNDPLTPAEIAATEEFLQKHEENRQMVVVVLLGAVGVFITFIAIVHLVLWLRSKKTDGAPKEAIQDDF
jgi:hypothetical protein